MSLDRVLVWDHDAAARARLAGAFRGLGLRAVEARAAGGLGAAAAMAEADLVVVEPWSGRDMRLDLVDDVGAARPAARIVIASAYASLPVACDAIRRGAHACLTKPVTPRQILAAARGGDGEESGDRGACGGDRIDGGDDGDGGEPLSLARVEWEYIQWMLWSCAFNKSEAARRLGLRRSTLQRKLAKYPPPAHGAGPRPLQSRSTLEMVR